MDTLNITLAILAPVITYLIGRYFRSEKIKELIKTISKIYDLKNTPFLIQTIVNNDEVSVIEFSPRIGVKSK
jgi:hypothetical protein